VAQFFGVAWLNYLVLRARRAGSIDGAEEGGGRPPNTDRATEKLLEEDFKERHAATIADRRRFLQSVTGKSVSVSTVKRLLSILCEKGRSW
jgi:transposase